MELTGTNRSIGLIVLIANAHQGSGKRHRARTFCEGARQERLLRSDSSCATLFFAFCRLGGYGGVSKPDPIPNSVVKRLSADGTMS
jgi:hypothetical protein